MAAAGVSTRVLGRERVPPRSVGRVARVLLGELLDLGGDHRGCEWECGTGEQVSLGLGWGVAVEGEGGGLCGLTHV